MTIKEQEIELVYQVITHPAGYILDLFGNMLYIRSYFVETGTEWEVTWEDIQEGSVVVDSFKQFLDAREAATFFVEKRYEMQLGIDIESSLMKGELHE
jgi:hypothetical protein